LKKLPLLLVLVCAAFGAVAVQKANRLMRLGWTENPPEEGVALYTVRVTGPLSTNLDVTVPPVELTNIFRDFPNGQYTITVSATGFSGLESLPSEPLAVFWYGNKPNPPRGLTIHFP
jgi:hypothetical protein